VADDPIQIVVTDGVASTIAPKLEGIATASVSAADATAQLQAQISKSVGITNAASISVAQYEAILANMSASTKALNTNLLQSAEASNAGATAMREYSAAEEDALSVSIAVAEAIRVQDGVIVNMAKDIGIMAAAMREADASLIEEEAAFAAVSASLAAHNAQIGTANTLVQEFRANLTAVAATETEVATATGELKTSFASLGGFIIAAFGVGELAKAADTYIQFTNSIKLAGLSANDTAIVMDRLRDTADRNGVTIASVSTIYRRLALEQDRLHASTDDIIHAIDTVTDAFRINGTSAAASQRVIYDLSEALSGNTVQWRNMRGIITQAPEVLQLAANGIQSMNGDVNKLTEALKGSKFSTEEFFKGLVNGYKEADIVAAKTTLTISGTTNVLINAFDLFVGKSGEASGAIQFVNAAILLVARNLPLVADAVIAYGAAWLLVKSYNIAADLISLGITITTVTIPAIYQFGVTLVTETIPAITAFSVAVLTEGIPAFVAMAAGLAEPTLIVLAIAAAFVAVGVSILAVTGHLDLIPKTIAAVTDGFKSAFTAVTGAAASFLGLNQNSAAAGAQLDNIRQHLGNFTEATAPAKAGTDALSSALKGANDNATTLKSSLVNVATAADGTLVYVNRLSAGVYQLKYSIDQALVSAQDFSKEYANAFSAAGQNSDISYLPKQTSFPDFTPLPAPKFAGGGSLIVNGTGGTDTTHVDLWATPGERIDVLTPQQQSQQAANSNKGDTHIHVGGITIVANDPNQFRESRAQIARDIGSIITVASKNG
jgi:hypothetical protein